ncbi:ChaN family lipoprotein [Pseudomonas sp. GOM7]|uniref:ChaN family lipoprotein n=1 Tax=Pseudomonas sp. GOM7 TaxID=2998079 RepID=UPI00227BA24E|nr:ChaN family lipoprotein [Pseudomonas sp. GOM7]WAJ36603.1 ChaN family lipoprotein [Pseudomonas sp. GOM7]
MRILFLCSLLLLAACQSHIILPPPQPLAPLGREHVEFGQIYDLRTGERLSPERLLERLARVQRVLVGERHDNPDHHALQLWLSRGLAVYRAQGSVLMEMINPDQQARIARAQRSSRAGMPPQDAIAALAWQPGWSWSLYGPLVLYQLRQPYPLLAANLDRDEIQRIYRQRPALVGERSNATQVQQRLLQDIRLSHCDMLPQSQLPAMLAVQQQRDRRMAEALLAAPQPSLLLAGAFHVRKDLGVPLHLADLQAPGSQAVLLLAEVGQRVDAQMADYVWYTARMPQEDFCAHFKR